MYVNLRRYPKIGVSRQEIEASARAELLPELARQRGFRRYRAFWTKDEQAVSVSVFDAEDAARQSTDTARRWIMRHQDFFPERGVEFSGECIMDDLPGREQQAGQGREPGYMLVSEWEGLSATDRLRSLARNALPMLARSAGFRGAYVVKGGKADGQAAFITEFMGKQDAVTCHERLAQMLAQDMPGLKMARIVHGQTGIAAGGE